jgi:hypothetical protein
VYFLTSHLCSVEFFLIFGPFCTLLPLICCVLFPPHCKDMPVLSSDPGHLKVRHTARKSHTLSGNQFFCTQNVGSLLPTLLTLPCGNFWQKFSLQQCIKWEMSRTLLSLDAFNSSHTPVTPSQNKLCFPEELAQTHFLTIDSASKAFFPPLYNDLRPGWGYSR